MFEPLPRPEDVQGVYATWSQRRRVLYDASEALRHARQDLAAQEADLLVNQKVTGKNELERSVRLREALPDLYADVAQLEDELQEARFRFDLAEKDVEYVRFQLRYLEMRTLEGSIWEREEVTIHARD